MISTEVADLMLDADGELENYCRLLKELKMRAMEDIVVMSLSGEPTPKMRRAKALEEALIANTSSFLKANAVDPGPIVAKCRALMKVDLN